MREILGRAPLPALFVRYAVPGVIGLLFFGIQSIVDGIIVGNYVGSNALAGVNLIMPLYNFIGVISIMIGIGSQTLVSIGFGEKDFKKSADAMTTGFVAMVALSILLSAVFFFFKNSIVVALGADDQVINYSVDYLSGLIPFIPSVALMFYSDYMLKALGHPRFSMIIMTVSVAVNFCLSMIFVIVLEMGTFGVGLATGVSFTLGAVIYSFITFNRNNLISMLGGKFRFRLLWNMIYNGSSEGVSELAIGISLMVMNLTLMKYAGADGVAAFTAINYIYFVGTTIFLGVSDGIIPIISYNHGAGKKERVVGMLRFAAKNNLVIGLILFSVLMFFGNDITSLFFKEDNQATALASQGAVVYAFAFLFNGFNILSSSFFTAIANAKVSVIISSLRGVVFTVISLSILPLWLGTTGIWMSTPLAEVLTFVVAFLLLKKGGYFR